MERKNAQPELHAWGWGGFRGIRRYQSAGLPAPPARLQDYAGKQLEIRNLYICTIP